MATESADCEKKMWQPGGRTICTFQSVERKRLSEAKGRATSRRERKRAREREREHRSRGHVEDARCVTAWRGRADLDRRVEDRVRKKRKEPRRESKDKRGKKGGERELGKEGGTNKSV